METNAENPEAKSGPRAASYYLGGPGGQDGGVRGKASRSRVSRAGRVEPPAAGTLVKKSLEP